MMNLPPVNNFFTNFYMINLVLTTNDALADFDREPDFDQKMIGLGDVW